MICFAAPFPVLSSRIFLSSSVVSHQRSPSVIFKAQHRLTNPIMSVSAETVRSRPAQIVLSPLPRIYVYDHCPYATRVRYALGVKNVKHQLTWLLNDDVDTPTALVGKKVVPIFQPRGFDGPAVMESMDICKAVDSDLRYGATGRFRNASGRFDISNWFAANAVTIRRLTRPRIVQAHLPEFAFEDAREAFVRNHPLPEPSDYETNLKNTKALLAELQSELQALNDMICSPLCCTDGGISFDDVDLFPRLRTLTLLKDLVMPQQMVAYLNHHSIISDVALYNVFAT